MTPLLVILKNPVTGNLEVVPNRPMRLMELVGLLDVAKMQVFENFKRENSVDVLIEGRELPRLKA
jgi:hypothetical protein